MITQSNKDELNISRILIQCSLDESRFHTCKVPRRGDMTLVVVVVSNRIESILRHSLWSWYRIEDNKTLVEDKPDDNGRYGR